ncbi:uncharacterized protein LOC142231039 [Haematobia irritans]|uniref:uncharacterized protein LOC142231039 n=1 Tax=Haematobia irritans TaxID=7368 RepID=UPI003F4F8FEE
MILMWVTKMKSSLIIYGIIVLLSSNNKLEAKDIQKDINTEERAKRGYSKYAENDFGPAVHVSSAVIQYSMPAEHVSLDTGSSYDHTAWQPSSSNVELWPQYPIASDIPSHTIATSHSGGEHISNSVISSDSQNNGGLHTQIIASSGVGELSGINIDHQNVVHVSDNVDFNNIADLNNKHYAKSYGK